MLKYHTAAVTENFWQTLDLVLTKTKRKTSAKNRLLFGSKVTLYFICLENEIGIASTYT